MPKTFDEVFEICLEKIRSGMGTIESCIQDFPTHASKLRETLPLAVSLFDGQNVKPTPQFSKNAGNRMAAKLGDRSVTFWGFIRRIFTEPKLLSTRRFGMSQIIITIVLAIGMLTGGSYAVQAAGPGDLLYGVDLAIEQARLKLTANPEQQAALQLKFASERLVEAEKKLEAGKPEDAGEALSAHNQLMTNLAAFIQNAGELDQIALRTMMQEELAFQQGILDRLRINWPEDAQARSAYQTALERANMGADSLLGPPETAPQGPAEDVPQGSDSENAQGPAEEAPQGPGEEAPQGPGETEPGGPSEEAPQGPTEEAPQGPTGEAPNGPGNGKP